MYTVFVRCKCAILGGCGLHQIASSYMSSIKPQKETNDTSQPEIACRRNLKPDYEGVSRVFGELPQEPKNVVVRVNSSVVHL